jgi:cytochrome c oxidase assembly factor CtaG
MKEFSKQPARWIWILLLAVCIQTSAFAHGGKPHNFYELWRTWAFEPVVLTSLGLSLLLYVIGVTRVWRKASAGRLVSKYEVLAFAFGWLALFIALVSPLHPWGRVLFSAHMTQHEVLMLIAAPLLVLGRPALPFLWALPLNAARFTGALTKTKPFQRYWRFLTNPFVAWAIHALALWIWHIPVLFEATLTSELVHTLQHLSFLLSALLFWWSLIHGPQGLMGFGAATLYVFTTSLHSGLLGALITFANTAWYPSYSGYTASWGLTPLEDQQLGGLIMWIPAGLVYILAGLVLFAGWLRESEVKALRYKERTLLRAE